MSMLVFSISSSFGQNFDFNVEGAAGSHAVTPGSILHQEPNVNVAYNMLVEGVFCEGEEVSITNLSTGTYYQNQTHQLDAQTEWDVYWGKRASGNSNSGVVYVNYNPYLPQGLNLGTLLSTTVLDDQAWPNSSDLTFNLPINGGADMTYIGPNGNTTMSTAYEYSPSDPTVQAIIGTAIAQSGSSLNPNDLRVYTLFIAPNNAPFFGLAHGVSVFCKPHIRLTFVVKKAPEGLNESYTLCPGEEMQHPFDPSTIIYADDIGNGTQTYTGLATSGAGCPANYSFTVTVNEPLNELLNTDFLCSNDLPFTFSPDPNGTSEAYAIWVDGGLVYDYNYGPLNPSPGVTVDPGTEEISIVASGTYHITFQYMVDNDPNNLCKKEYVLIVERSPLVDLGEDIILCSNTPMPTLSAGSNNAQCTYQWFREVSIGQWAVPIWVVLPVISSTYMVPIPGKYMVTVTSPWGCENSDIINVIMSPSANPDPSFHMQENDINSSYYELTVTPETIPGLHFWYVNNAAPNGQNTFSWSTFNTFNMPYDYFHTVRHYVRQFPCNEWRWTEKISWMESDSKSGREKSMGEGPFSEVFTATDEEIEALISGIENQTAYLTEDKVRVYPNPTDGRVKLTLAENCEYSDIVVLNNIGQKVRVVHAKAQKLSYDLDLSDQSEGVYFIRVNSKSNSIMKKLVIR